MLTRVLGAEPSRRRATGSEGGVAWGDLLALLAWAEFDDIVRQAFGNFYHAFKITNFSFEIASVLKF